MRLRLIAGLLLAAFVVIFAMNPFLFRVKPVKKPLLHF